MLNSTLSFQFPISTAEASAASRPPGCRRWRRWHRWRRCYGTKVGAAHAGAVDGRPRRPQRLGRPKGTLSFERGAVVRRSHDKGVMGVSEKMGKYMKI